MKLIFWSFPRLCNESSRTISICTGGFKRNPMLFALRWACFISRNSNFGAADVLRARFQRVQSPSARWQGRREEKHRFRSSAIERGTAWALCGISLCTIHSIKWRRNSLCIRDARADFSKVRSGFSIKCCELEVSYTSKSINESEE